MMIETPATFDAFRVGRVWGRGFSIMMSNFAAFMILAVVVHLPFLFLEAGIAARAPEPKQEMKGLPDFDVGCDLRRGEGVPDILRRDGPLNSQTKFIEFDDPVAG